MKKWLFLLLTALLLALCGAALAETARVVTPGGALNMRKKADEKSKLVSSVPNKSQVEVEETEGEWSKITYKKQTGYVKTEFLKLPSQLPGQTVYSDGGTLLLRSAPDASAPLICPLSCLQPVSVLAVEGGWAQVRWGQMQGWTETALLSFQFAAPAGSPDWMAENGRVESECGLLSAPKEDSAVLSTLTPGQTVTVTLTDGAYCLALTEQGCGYVPAACLSLSGPEDTPGQAGAVTPMEAVSAAESALKKQLKAWSKEKLYCVVQPEENAFGAGVAAYRCGFFSDEDQYRYAALVDAETGKALLVKDYTLFSARKKDSEALPKGEMALSLSAETLAVGQVLDITVAAWENCQCRYQLKKDGAQAAESEFGPHFQASYRPREAGEYTLSVTVRDGEGLEKTMALDFSVDASLPPLDGLEEIYSQRDGWWLKKKYRHSNLSKSGCAIFTLSHALERMGHTEQAAQPEALAEKYAYCLIPEEGTSNELLINTAAKDFGFDTRAKLYNDQKQIAQLLRDGAYFSFSIARGHIALVSGLSEDGSMVRVVDSAPQATFERIVNAAPYYQLRSGAFRAALSLDDLPGARWYFETDEYGGLEYYLPLEYAARRGVRLIQPAAQP